MCAKYTKLTTKVRGAVRAGCGAKRESF